MGINLHIPVRMNSAAPLETEDDVDTLSVLHEVRREHYGDNTKKGRDSISVLFFYESFVLFTKSPRGFDGDKRKGR